jgi:hypothetical protein
MIERTEYGTSYKYTLINNVKYLPEDAVPKDVMDTEEGWRMSFNQPMMKKEKEMDKKEPVTFMEYVSYQQEHISQYYEHIEFSIVPIRIYELLKSSHRINIATDGGAIPLKGSLGFVFADTEGNILLSCYGQPSGNNPLSFRSEICAFLAAIRLIKLLITYYDNKINCKEPTRSKIQVYTDSLSMITK